MSRRRATCAGAAVLVGLATLTACAGSDEPLAHPTTTSSSSTGSAGGGSTTAAGSSDAPKVEPVVAAHLHEPIDMVARPGDPDHVWVAERGGRVRRLALAHDGTKLVSDDGDASLLDITKQTTTDAERGLLGIAFSPDGDQLFVSYTNNDGNTRLVSYEVTGSVDRPTVDVDSAQVRFGVDQPYPNHNGGHIAFGPDGKLWLGLGDGGLADDPGNRAQDPDTPLGKIVRFDVLHDGGEVDPEIVVMGVRNPWRWAFDTDGSLWIGDVGQDAIEEVDHLAAGHIDGTNLGWSGYEGKEPYLDGDGRRPDDATPPIFQYRHEDGNCSITGGFVYRGKAIPALAGAYLFADYCAGHLRALRLDGDGDGDGGVRELDLGLDVANPISFGTDAAGEVYVLSQGGDVVRLVPAR